nr:MAG TPA: hypothetical protein [Microviridae sp.]
MRYTRQGAEAPFKTKECKAKVIYQLKISTNFKSVV